MSKNNGVLIISGIIMTGSKLPTIKIKRIKKGKYNVLRYYRGSYFYTKEDLSSFKGFNLIKDKNISKEDEAEILGIWSDKVINFLEQSQEKVKNKNPYFNRRNFNDLAMVKKPIQ